jgi:hypothetical protein
MKMKTPPVQTGVGTIIYQHLFQDEWCDKN